MKTTAKISCFSLLIYCVGCGSNPSQQATTQDPAAVPSIAQVLPQTIPAGSQTATLKIMGANFPSQAVILWNGGAVATTVVDSTTLSGTITGSSLATPATAQLQVQNAQTMQESQAVLITISATSTASTSPVAISTTTLPQATVGTAYQVTLAAAGGTSPYTWSISSGVLPTGLSVAADTGIISGTPTSSSNESFSVTAVDSSSPAQSVMATLALSVAAAPIQTAPVTISSSSIASGTVGAVYSASLTAAGGSSPYTWSISSGALPAGLSLAAETGIISGTPTSSGNDSFGITATDSSSPAKSATATLALAVVAAPVVPVAPSVPVAVLPAPPSSASAYLNLQDQSGWKVCNGVCAGSPSTATGTSSLTPGIATPSMSGSAMAQNSVGTDWNTLYYLHVGCPSGGCAAVSNILEDMYFQTTSTSDMQGSEFDPDLYDGTYEYFASLQCRLVGTDAGNWFLWNMSASRWEMTGYPCTATTLAPGSWHHFQLYATFDTTAHTYTYDTFVFDGVTIFQNLGTTYEAAPLQGTATVNIEQQIDNGEETSPVPNNTNYYDKVNLWVW